MFPCTCICLMHFLWPFLFIFKPSQSGLQAKQSPFAPVGIIHCCSNCWAYCQLILRVSQLWGIIYNKFAVAVTCTSNMFCGGERKIVLDVVHVFSPLTVLLWDISRQSSTEINVSYKSFSWCIIRSNTTCTLKGNRFTCNWEAALSEMSVSTLIGVYSE